ncbi:GTPase [Mycoplasma bradburyae]|uniref:50S ribosome-binding GTPase n=1 Tax=Mycoplasma bradburyae TaxID=2963128 RepID=A0AAW6HMI2_9MOLU|nr:GTPase [Mycoplasma bradburyae]MDC4183062.1 50S ribosome-binding GTPase [Mycoplasma bradburyae]UTS70700.1 50S ribosome-binding GTPase [Mycoplasma bradburyae]
MNKKCQGCGNYLSDNINDLGYCVDINRFELCKRCFQFKHYKKVDEKKIVVKQDIDDYLKTLELKNYCVFYLVDPTNFIFDLETIKRLINSYRFYLIFNKIDYLAKKNNLEQIKEKIINNLKHNGIELQYSQILFNSIYLSYDLRKIDELVKKAHINRKKAVFLGQSNVGKSSLINKLLKLNDIDKKEFLTTSPYLNTTLKINQIKKRGLCLLDTPGYLDESNGLYELDSKRIKRLISHQWKNPITFQISSNQIFYCEDFIKLKVYLDENIDKTSITFYCPTALRIHRTSVNNEQTIDKKINNIFSDLTEFNYLTNDNFSSYDLNNSQNNLLINGVCLIKLNKGIKKIEVYKKDKIRDCLLIINLI